MTLGGSQVSLCEPVLLVNLGKGKTVQNAYTSQHKVGNQGIWPKMTHTEQAQEPTVAVSLALGLASPLKKIYNFIDYLRISHHEPQSYSPLSPVLPV